jgi:hypothetical protein
MLARSARLGAPPGAPRRAPALARINGPGPGRAGALPCPGRAPSWPAPASRPLARGRARTVAARAFFGKMFKQDASENTRKKYQDRVEAINALEPSMQALSDDALRAKTDEFRARVKRGESLDALLPEAFAVRGRAEGGALRGARCAARGARCVAAAAHSRRVRAHARRGPGRAWQRGAPHAARRRGAAGRPGPHAAMAAGAPSKARSEGSSKAPPAAGPRTHLPAPAAGRARGVAPRAGAAPLRRAAHRRHDPARGPGAGARAAGGARGEGGGRTGCYWGGRRPRPTTSPRGG